MQVKEIIDLIDEDKLQELGNIHKIDKVNNKITGKFILKSFISCILKGYDMSLRSLELLCNSNKDIASLLNAKNIDNKKIDHSSIGKRLAGLTVDYFKDIYEDLVIKYNAKFIKKEKNKFHRFDSTIISLSSKLLKDSLNLGGTSKDRQIKISFGLKHSIPSSARFCKEQSDSNENIALVQAINEAKIEKQDILLFDRGISKAQTFKDLTESEKFFITRVNVNRKYSLVKTNDIKQNKSAHLKIESDETVNLYNSKSQKINCNLRLIKAQNDKNEALWFLTNIFYLSTEDVCNSYKRRWDIEVFFKFIKQHLQFKTFISYNQNGMSVYIYCILISAILFTIFKITNKLKGFKIALLQFTLKLEKEIIKDIVLFCGGNPDMVELKL